MSDDDLLIRFAEWLDNQGLLTDPAHTDPLDERTHEELATDFLAELDA